MNLSFKKEEHELYLKIQNASSSPGVFVKDVLAAYFKSKERQPKRNFEKPGEIDDELL